MGRNNEPGVTIANHLRLVRDVHSPAAAVVLREDGRQVDLAWPTVTGAVWYRVYRSDAPPAAYSEVHAGAGLTWSDRTELGSIFYYQIVACLSTAEESCIWRSDPVPVTVPPPLPNLIVATRSIATALTWSGSDTNYHTLEYATTRDGTYSELYAGHLRSWSHTGLAPKRPTFTALHLPQYGASHLYGGSHRSPARPVPDSSW